MGKVPRIKVEQSINTQGERKNKVAPFEKSQRAIHCEAQNCCEPSRVQTSHCSLFELAGVPNRTCRRLICSDSKEVPKVTRRLWHVSPCSHSGYTVLLHKILHLSFPVCSHPSLLFSLFSFPPSELCGSLLMLVFI